MTALASSTVWQQAYRAVAGMFASDSNAAAPDDDPWAGRRFTILHRAGADVEVRDASGRTETITLGFGARQTLDAFVATHSRADAVGLILIRESFCLEGLAFWRWTVEV